MVIGQVWKIAKMAIESLVWRQVGIFYGGMGPAIEDAAQLSPEERDGWKTLVFPVEASDSSSSSVQPVTPVGGSSSSSLSPTSHTTSSLSSGPAAERRSSARPGSAPTSSSVASIASSLPVPYWWIMFLLLSLTWLNAFMVARLFTAAPDSGSGSAAVLGQLGTAVAPPAPPVPKPPPFDVFTSVDWHRFVDDQKQFRQSQVSPNFNQKKFFTTTLILSLKRSYINNLKFVSYERNYLIKTKKQSLFFKDGV